VVAIRDLMAEGPSASEQLRIRTIIDEAYEAACRDQIASYAGTLARMAAWLRENGQKDPFDTAFIEYAALVYAHHFELSLEPNLDGVDRLDEPVRWTAEHADMDQEQQREAGRRVKRIQELELLLLRQVWRTG
jgi:hypothetical protein